MNDFKIDLAIIVYSCYKNKDMWNAFSFFFEKYYKNNNFKLVLVTDRFDGRDDYSFDEVVEYDGCWSEMIKKAITEANVDYVMLFMDDYLLTDYVNENALLEALNDIKKYHAQNIRLINTNISKMEKYTLDEGYNRLIPGSAYCLSTQAGIWEVAFLLEYLSDGLSAWEFERNGSLSIKNKDILLLESRKYSFPYLEAVRKGKWINSGISHCKNNGFMIDFSAREKMSVIDTFVSEGKGLIMHALPDVIQRIQNRRLYK